MEWNEVQTVWKTSEPEREIPKEEIQQALKGASSRGWGTIIQHVKGEILWLVILGLFTAGILVQKAIPFAKWEILLIAAYWGISFLVLWSKFSLLNTSAPLDKNPLEHLSQVSEKYARYLSLYTFLNIWIVPLMGSAAIVYGFYKGLIINGILNQNISPIVWFFLIALIIVYNIFAVQYFRKHISRTYRKPFEELKASLAELQE